MRLLNAVDQILGLQERAGIPLRGDECLGGNGYVEEAFWPA